MKWERIVNKIIRFIQTYLICGFPFVVACMVWETIYTQNEILANATFITKMIWNLLGWNLLLWFVVLIVFLIMLIIIPSVRENTLKRLANLQDRDEREEYITGQASRTAYVATLSLMIFFLFFSIFSFNVERMSPDHAIDGKRLAANISVSFNLLEKSQVGNDNQNSEILFTSKNFSLSTSAIILILLAWQLLAFNIAARKEKNKGL